MAQRNRALLEAINNSKMHSGGWAGRARGAETGGGSGASGLLAEVADVLDTAGAAASGAADRFADADERLYGYRSTAEETGSPVDDLRGRVDLNSPTDPSPALALIAAEMWTRLSASPRNLGCRVPRGTTHRTHAAGWLCGRCNAARHPDEPWT